MTSAWFAFHREGREDAGIAMRFYIGHCAHQPPTSFHCTSRTLAPATSDCHGQHDSLPLHIIIWLPWMSFASSPVFSSFSWKTHAIQRLWSRPTSCATSCVESDFTDPVGCVCLAPVELGYHQCFTYSQWCRCSFLFQVTEYNIFLWISYNIVFMNLWVMCFSKRQKQNKSLINIFRMNKRLYWLYVRLSTRIWG